MNSMLILFVITLLTLAGDYFVKVASSMQSGLGTREFFLGALLYGLPSIGWFFLMRSHSLATIGVLYSASTIILLAAMGVFVFKEPFSLREAAGVGLAVLAVIVINH